MSHEMSEMQTKMLQMMLWFHNYCGKNDIAYYMIGGTMLGAARHQGFIPWDDDIDVGVPRKDYCRLLEIAKALKPGRDQYIFESYHDGNPDYQYAYAKLYDTHTTLIENKHTMPKRGIFIDIFPLDGIGDTQDEAYRNFQSINRQLDLLTLATSEVRKGRAWQKNLLVKIIKVLPFSLFNAEKIIIRLDELCSMHPFETSVFVGNLVGMYRKKEIVPKEAFGTPALYDFEDVQFYGVEKADMYLTNIYHNWRQLPPPEKQKSEHDFCLLDLHHPYIE